MLTLTATITGKQFVDVEGQLDTLKDALVQASSGTSDTLTYALTGTAVIDVTELPPFPAATTFAPGDRVRNVHDHDFTGTVAERRDYMYRVTWDSQEQQWMRRDYLEALT